LIFRFAVSFNPLRVTSLPGIQTDALSMLRKYVRYKGTRVPIIDSCDINRRLFRDIITNSALQAPLHASTMLPRVI